MFLPSTDSFVFIQKTTSKKIRPVFFPNTDSFVLVRKSVSESAAEPVVKFALESVVVPEVGGVVETIPELKDGGQEEVADQGRRNFLKVATVAGAGIIASQISPQKAHALIMGSSPTTGIIGVKDSTNTRVNPATEETLSEVLKTSDLTFDAGSLQVKVTSLPSSDPNSFSDSGDVAKSALVDADRHVQVDVLSSVLPASASTETTLQTISFGGFKFALRLATVGSVDYVGEAAIGTATSAASWRIKKVDSTTGIHITWAGSGVFDQVWDNHASLSYS